jgi:magnesium transporter
MVYEEHIENLREVIEGLTDADDLGNAVSLLATRHPADQADLLEHLDEGTQNRLLLALPGNQLAEILEYLDDDTRRRLLSQMPPNALAPVLDRVDSDIAADIVKDLEPEHAEAVVSLLEEREEVEELLAYPESSAGARMSTDIVALQRDWTVQEAIDFLRDQQPDPEHPFYLYVVDREGVLLGIVNLRNIITARPEMPLTKITSGEVISVRDMDDQEVAAERMRHYNLLALPVVDALDRIVGVITADEVLDVQVEEATEDMYHMAGLTDEERLFRPMRESVPPRLGWLLFNLATAFVGATMVNLFEGTIERVAALAVFMPMVAGMAGNAGLQTLTLVVRSIALGEVETRDAVRVLKRESVIALINGIVLGSLVGLIAWLWKDSAWLGLIVGLALLANIANAMFSGVLVPMTLRRLNKDPALGSGVIVMLSDALGFLFFLGLATLLISELD